MLAIVVAACSSGGATTSTVRGGHGGPLGRAVGRTVGRPVGRADGRPAAAPPAAPSAAGPALEGEITIWHSYGSSGGGAEFADVHAEPSSRRSRPPTPASRSSRPRDPFARHLQQVRDRVRRRRRPGHVHRPERQPRQRGRASLLADLTGKIDDVLANTRDSRSTAAWSTASSTWSPSRSRPWPCTTTPPRSRRRRRRPMSCSPSSKAGGKVGVFDGTDGLYHGFGFYGGLRRRADGRHRQVRRDSGGVADAFKYVADLKAAGAVVDANYDDDQRRLQGRHLDLIFNGPWALGGYKRRLGATSASRRSRPARSADAAADRRRRLVHQRQQPEHRPRGRLALAMHRQRRVAAGLVDIGGPLPANTTVTSTDPLVTAFADGRRHGRPAAADQGVRQLLGPLRQRAGPRSSTTGADPAAAVADACATMDKANSM